MSNTGVSLFVGVHKNFGGWKAKMKDSGGHQKFSETNWNLTNDHEMFASFESDLLAVKLNKKPINYILLFFIGSPMFYHNYMKM